VEGTALVFPVRRLSGDGRKAWEEVLARGIEGYVGKDPSSTYLSGGPTRSWLKAKVRHEGRFIVGGVVERTEGWSLLLGTIQSGGLEQRR
jgi:ATP-dependent DNA ligase